MEKPEQAQERRAGVRELLEDIATLPEVQRHALLRRELDGQSHEEIASELGLTEGSTKSLVFRARANLPLLGREDLHQPGVLQRAQERRLNGGERLGRPELGERGEEGALVGAGEEGLGGGQLPAPDPGARRNRR